MSQVETETSHPLEISEEALSKVLEIRSSEDNAESVGLRVEITGNKGVDFTYDLSFLAVTEAAESDVVYEIESLPIIIPEQSRENLNGSTLDLPSNAAQGGLIIRNPNRPNLMEGMDFTLTGTIAEKLQQLLDQQINPSLAAHGGYAQLVGVEETVAYLTMGGGCQGCSMSAATLREGITVIVGEAIPEITDVVDVTDHEAGDNPFYS